MDALGETKPNFPIKRCYSSRPRDVKLTPQQIEDDIEMVRGILNFLYFKNKYNRITRISKT